MLRETEDANTPLAVQLAVRDHHNGLRYVELGQMKGQRSYTKITDGRWTLRTVDGEEADHDEAPETPADEVARTVYQAAADYRARHGGDARFRMQLWCATKKGETEAFDVKFTIEDDAASPETDAVEDRARANLIDTLTRAYGEQHRRLMEQHKSLGDIAKGLADVMRIPVEAMGAAMQLRIEALEDRIEAVLADDDMPPRRGSKRITPEVAEQWKEARQTLKELASGPIGKAAAAKLLGIEPEEALRLFGGGPATGDNDLRQCIIELGKLLTDEQKTQLKSELGKAVDVESLYKAALADSDEKAADVLVDFFARLEAAELMAVPEGIFDDKQSKLYARIMTLTQTVAERVVTEAEEQKK